MSADLPRRPPFARLYGILRVRPRLVAGVAVGLASHFLLPSGLESPTRLLIGWNLGIVVYLGLTWEMMARSDVARLRQRAIVHDEGEWTIILLSMAATLASLVAIGVEMHRARLGSDVQIWRVALAAATIFASWFFIHSIMAQHYAHDHYLREGRESGLIFPDRIKEPDYWDFLYFAFTIGAAGQTSDVAIASPRMRRVALAHTVLSFLFNTTILALGINVGASLL